MLDTLIDGLVALVTHQDLYPFVGFIMTVSLAGGLFRYLGRAAK